MSLRFQEFGLRDELLHALDEAGYTTPTPIQEEAIPILLEGHDLIGIADALRTSFPRNVEMCARWMRQPHKRFANKTPLNIMVTKGLPGLIQVRAQLDCSFAWNTSGS